MSATMSISYDLENDPDNIRVQWPAVWGRMVELDRRGTELLKKESGDAFEMWLNAINGEKNAKEQDKKKRASARTPALP